ncbi:hypothetical protein Tco_0768722, partial [Tanacetum coccineum]
MILATILSTAPTIDSPIIHDDTLLIPTDTPTISPIVPTIPPVAPTIQYISPFICTDSSDCDTPDTPPSLNPYEVTVAQRRSRVAARSSPSSPPIRQILPAPYGLPYQLSVGSLHTHRIALRYSTDYSSSDCFTSDDTSRDSSSDSSLDTSSDSHLDASSDSSSRHSSSCYAILDSPCDSPTATSAGPSRKRCRSPTSSVLVDSPVRRALSPVRVDLFPLPKRIRDSNSVTDLEVSLEEGYVPYVPREVGLGVDVEDSYDPYTEPDVDSDIQVNIDECIMFVGAIRARGTDVRDVVETAAKEEVEEDVPDHDLADGAVESVQRFQGHRIAGVDLEVTTMTERISICRTMSTATRSEMTQEAINELLAKRVEEALKAYDAAKNPKTETEMENEKQDKNVEANVSNGNGNGNGNGNPNVNNKVGVDAAYAMMWKALMKLMTQMVPKEEDQVEKYIRGLLNNIQGNLKGYAIKNSENKRRFDNNSRDNNGQQQQQPFKRQNVNGHNVARAYTVGNNIERIG